MNGIGCEQCCAIPADAPGPECWCDCHDEQSPRRIQRQRTKGWRMPEGAVYVGRPSRWGSPFGVTEHFVYGKFIDGYTRKGLEASPRLPAGEG